jgi:phosphate acetyltransferase
MFEHELLERARADRQRIVLPEGTDDRILLASEILRKRGVVDLTLLGRAADLRQRMAALGVDDARNAPATPCSTRTTSAR